MGASILRPKNLFIVALTQFAVYYLVLYPALHTHNSPTVLNHFLFFLFVIVTLIIAAAGYIINDMYDRVTDAVNRPEKTHILSHKDFLRAKRLYVFLILTGAVLSFSIAYIIDHLLLFLIYPVACTILFFYAMYFKGNGLSGNLVVALFCAFVPGILLFAERDSFSSLLQSDPYAARWIMYVFGGYIIFAFLATLVREIIKDIQDFHGDLAQKYRTLPIRIGFSRVKKLAVILYIFLILLCGIWIFFLSPVNPISLLSYGVLVMLPLFIGLHKLAIASLPEEMKSPSRALKATMLGGLIFLIIYTQMTA